MALREVDTALVSSLASAADVEGRGSDGRGVLWTEDVMTELPVRIAHTFATAHVPSAAPASGSVVLAHTPNGHATCAADVGYVGAGELPVTLPSVFIGRMTAHLRSGSSDAVELLSTLALRVERPLQPPASTTSGGAVPPPQWLTWTYAQYYNDVVTFARALLHPRVRVGVREAVCVCASNAPEWAIAAYGAIFAGAVQAGIYTTNTPSAVGYVLEHSRARVAVVDDASQLSKVLTLIHTRDRARAAARMGSSAGGESDAARAVSARHESEPAFSLSHLSAVVLSTGELPQDVRAAFGPGAQAKGGVHSGGHEAGGGTVTVYTWKEFMALGARSPASVGAAARESGGAAGDAQDVALAERLRAQRPGHCCTLIYTSGTTGNPKAVMLSHDNIIFTCNSAQSVLRAAPGEVIVSYLPLSHIAAQLTDLHGAMMTGVTVVFARPDALKGTLIQTLTAARPHYFLGVPRVYEKIEERLRAVGAANTGLRKAVGEWAKRTGTVGSAARRAGESPPWAYLVADAVIFRAIRKALGFDRCRVFSTGAAPISRSTLDYFASLGIIIAEAYGMSESTGPHTCNRPFDANGVRYGTVGTCIPGVELRIDAPNARGEGEICMRGRNVFMGYLNNITATRETIDPQGWLHSGDLGVIEPGGFVRITGRIKELLITAGGENVAPVLMEDALKAECTAISNVMLVGDRRKYIAALVTLKVDPDADGNPTDALSDVALRFASECGSRVTSASAATKCPHIRKSLDAAVKKANVNAISNAARIQRWTLVAPDFSIGGGELTPTMKLKRRVVIDKFARDVEQLYAEEPPTASAPRM